MSRVIEVIGSYKILATNRDYVVVNTRLDYENHAHFKSLQTLHQLLNIIEKGLVPSSPYLIKAAKRLLGEEYDALHVKRKKLSYFNHSQRH